MRDLYEILGVPRNANPHQIKKAYRKLAAQFHPDVNKAADAPEKFREAKLAYDILSDPDKRKTYDETGDAGVADESIMDNVRALQTMFLEVVGKEQPDVDLIAKVLAELDRNEIVVRGQHIPDRQKAIERLQLIRTRLRFNDEQPIKFRRNFLDDALLKKIGTYEQSLAEAERQLEMITELRDLLTAYSYDLEHLRRRDIVARSLEEMAGVRRLLR